MEFANTDAVPTSGEYRCTSCGDLQEFEADDDFTVCDSCGAEDSGWEPLGTEEAEAHTEDDGLGF